MNSVRYFGMFSFGIGAGYLGKATLVAQGADLKHLLALLLIAIGAGLYVGAEE